LAEGTVCVDAVLPYPWPPPKATLVSETPFDTRLFRITAQIDGTISFVVTDSSDGKSLGFVSQPFNVLGNRPRPVHLVMLHDSSKCYAKLFSMGVLYDLLPNAPNVPAITLVALVMPLDKSFANPNATAICKEWIDNRRAKFISPPQTRIGRKSKSVEAEAEDLRSSSLRMNHFVEGIRGGNTFLLGSLAGEMRASIYWPDGRDAKPDAQYNPLLLRMASKADLPLPVYCVPEAAPLPPAVADTVLQVDMDTPRITAIFPHEKIFDLQSVLLRTLVVRSIQIPGGKISGRNLIRELAHTMGSAHYDPDASEFVDLLGAIIGGQGDQVTSFMCETASTLVSLSEWVLSELKQRKVIL